MQIRLRSTSYLLPENSSWNYLKKNNKLDFAEYNNIFSETYIKKSVECEVFIFFLRDLFDYYLNDKKNIDIKKIKIIISTLKKTISSNKEKYYIVSLSSYFYSNIINETKNLSKEVDLENFFYKELYKLSNYLPNIYILNIDKAFAYQGYKECFDERNFSLFKCRLSVLGIEVLSKKINTIVESFHQTSKKVLLLDCDNTIWGGVIGEDGIEKIKLGQDGLGTSFKNFQKAIKKIKNNGVLIGLVSKNNKNDVVEVLKNHKSMVLKEKDISSLKINWKPKSENIKEISKELFLSLDSFVFWDDNPIERNKIKNEIEEVEVIEPDSDVSNWSKQLLEYKGFSKFKITSEDKKKTKQYKLRSLFIEDKTSSKSEIEYLKKIKLLPKFDVIKKDNIDRAEQLLLKTNQFNFSVKRYKSSQLKNMSINYNCNLIKLTDVYGDHGHVGLIIYKVLKKKYVLVDTFLMSCRIMGRYLENWILHQLQIFAKKKKITKILFECNLNKKNIELINQFIKLNNLKKHSSLQLTKLFKETKIKINKNSLYMFDTKTKIKKLEIYKNNKLN